MGAGNTTSGGARRLRGWCCGEDGQWRTVGELVEGATFKTMAVGADSAETRNKRQFEVKFDWASDPSKAWIPVRDYQGGAAVRAHEPDAAAATQDANRVC